MKEKLNQQQKWTVTKEENRKNIAVSSAYDLKAIETVIAPRLNFFETNQSYLLTVITVTLSFIIEIRRDTEAKREATKRQEEEH